MFWALEHLSQEKTLRIPFGFSCFFILKRNRPKEALIPLHHLHYLRVAYGEKANSEMCGVKQYSASESVKHGKSQLDIRQRRIVQKSVQAVGQATLEIFKAQLDKAFSKLI